MKVIRVLLADDHPALRASLRGMLERAGIEVVGEAADGDEALRLAEELGPDVLVLDAVMPGPRAPQVIRTPSEGASHLSRNYQPYPKRTMRRRGKPSSIIFRWVTSMG